MTHDWKNHIGEDLRSIWPQFTDTQRVTLARDADRRASLEEWDLTRNPA